MTDCPCIDARPEDDELPKRHVREMRTARKRWKCVECGAVIEPSERYEHVRGLWDQRYETYRTCEGCVEVRDAVLCGGHAYGELWDTLSNADVIRGDRAVERCWYDDLGAAGAAKLKAEWWKLVPQTA